MRIVITGATGFIGSYLAALFLREGAEVFALSRPDSPNLKALPVHENLHIVPWSMTGPETVFHRLVLQTHFSILPGAE